MSQSNVTLYAYLNITNPMVAWEVAIGRIRSACDTTREQFGVSVWSYSLLRRFSKEGKSPRFINELLLEATRQKTHPRAVSRLAGIYFFESERDAHNAVDRWGMPERKPFISEVSFSANHLTMVDSEWITSYLGSEERHWMEDYWQGKTLGLRPLTEVLASGIGMVRNNELRVEAYKRVASLWPQSTPLLSMACCAFCEEQLEDIGLSKPALMASNGVISGKHFIYIGDLEKNQEKIVRAVEASKQRGELPPATIPNDGQTFFALPDMTHMNFEFEEVVAASVLKSIHDAANDA